MAGDQSFDRVKGRWFFLCAFLLAGCGSLRIWKNPQLEVHVVDSDGRPISAVAVLRKVNGDRRQMSMGETDMNGHLVVVAESTKIHPIAPGCYGSRGTFSFVKTGFQTVTIDYNTNCASGDVSPIMAEKKIVLQRAD